MIKLRARFIGGPQNGEYTSGPYSPERTVLTSLDTDALELIDFFKAPDHKLNDPVKTVRYKLHTYQMHIQDQGDISLPLYVCETAIAPKSLLSALLAYVGE